MRHTKPRFAALTLATTLACCAPALAQTTPPAASQAATAHFVTRADLHATGTQLGQKIDAQADQLAALRQQLLAMKAQLELLDRQVNGMRVPPPPATSGILPGH